MCGIAGILKGAGERVEAADLRRMAAALAHRGPDDEGFHLDGCVGLAHRRLAILDLSPAGRQPMPNEDGTVQVVYNGQLYGFEPERARLEGRGHRFRSRTDTELLVHAYEERGEGMLDAIDGMFAFALWDAPRRRLLLARDRLGIKPLYVARHGSVLAFASELSALLALAWLPRDTDPLGIVQYLYQSSVPGGSTVLRGCRQLPPGHLLVAEAGEVWVRPYWQLPPEPVEPDARPLPEVAAEFRERLAVAVRSHLVADVPVGAFLSGGLDSSAVSLLARPLLPELHTFSVRFEGPASHDEGEAAREVASALGTQHHELRLGPGDLAAGLPAVVASAGEPFAVSSGLALHALARFARERVKVVLTGDGADESLGGYPWRHEPEAGPGSSPRSFLRGVAMSAVRSLRGARGGRPGLALELTSRLSRMLRPAERHAEIVCAFTPEEMEALLVPELAPLARQAWDENPVRRAYAGEAARDAVNRRLRADIRTTLVDEMLTKVDRMTMAAGLEARVPFLDRGLLEWTLLLPGRLKLRGGVGKALVREALQPALPRTAARPKHGFDVPLGPWLRGPLRGLLTDALAPHRVRRHGILRPGAVETLLAAHLAGHGDHSRKLFTLLALGLWLDTLAARGHQAQVAAVAST